MLQSDTVTDFCSDLSELHGEPIGGTAAEAKVWLGIEYGRPWEAKGVEKADFPTRVRERLEAWDAAMKDLRVQLLRRPGRYGTGPTVLVAVCDPGRSVVVEIHLAAIDDLAEIDVPDLVARVRAGEPPPVGSIATTPIVLVCTHGKRDRCCAKKGLPVYDRLAAHADLSVWQTSHLGGHRFAATMVWLPHGICYGRVRPHEVDALVAAQREGRVFRIDRYRGRTCYAAPAQAAEALVRERLDAMSLESVIVDRVDDLGDRWLVGGRVADRGFSATVRIAESGTLSPPSCGKDPEPITGYALVDLRT